MTALVFTRFMCILFPQVAHWIYQSSPFWPGKSLWTGLLPASCVYSCTICFSGFSLDVWICKLLHYNSMCRPIIDFEGCSLCFLEWMPVFFPRFGAFTAIICSDKVSSPFFWSSSPGNPSNKDIILVNGIAEYSKSHSFLLSFQLPYFPLLYVLCHWFILLPHSSTLHSFHLNYISIIEFLMLTWVDFSSFISIARDSLVLSMLVSSQAVFKVGI